MSKPATISFTAKCSDLFGAALLDKERNLLGEEHDGYVPKFFPGEHFGDYIEMEIDIETGRILNWVKPTDEELNVTFKHLDNE